MPCLANPQQPDARIFAVDGYSTDMMRPTAEVIFGDWAATAEIEGHVSLVDREGKTGRTPGHNPVKEQTATNKVKPEDWRTGILTAPHGSDFDGSGNLFVTEYNLYGRVLRYDC